MINIDTMEMGTTGTPKKIKAFEVWWRSPVGLHAHLEFAKQHCIACDLDPVRCLVPVVVATAVDGDYEEFAR
jgi:hypothetical protein